MAALLKGSILPISGALAWECLRLQPAQQVCYSILEMFIPLLGANFPRPAASSSGPIPPTPSPKPIFVGCIRIIFF